MRCATEEPKRFQAKALKLMDQCDEINRLNPILGLEGKATMCRHRRVEKENQTKGKVWWIFTGDGTLSPRELGSWPHSLRPEGYYEKSCKEMEKMMIVREEK